MEGPRRSSPSWLPDSGQCRGKEPLRPFCSHRDGASGSRNTGNLFTEQGLCAARSRIGLESPLRHLPFLLGVVTLAASPPCLVRSSLPGPRERRRSPPGPSCEDPPPFPTSPQKFLSSSWDLFSSSLWDPSWFWPLGDATRLPAPPPAAARPKGSSFPRPLRPL